jgi:tRNA A-37 threonylcarbamoyl transferase component Bud32
VTSKDDQPTAGTIPDSADEAYCSACNQSFTPDHVWCPNDGALLVKLKAAKDLLIGRVFEGRYQIKSALGEGGMGTVYRGLQLSLDREVAIKVIHANLAADRNTAKRFLREARLSSRLNQPNIINVYEFGQTEDGILYLAMELLRGRSLHQVIQSQFLELDRIQRIGLQLCDALEAAHNQGIIHRDLKPGNIMILDEPAGRDLLKVLDFGLAKSLVNDTTNITNTNALMGTPLYMSPEQVEGRPSDQRSDLYSLGCILYQMLTGRPPFVGDTINAVLSAHLRDAPAQLPERVPPELAAMMGRMLAKHPDQRVGSAAEIREVLSGIDVSRGLAGPRGPAALASIATGMGTDPVAAASSLERERRPRRWLWVVLLGLLVAGTGVFVIAKLARAPAVAPISADGRGPLPSTPIDAPSPGTKIDAATDAPIDAADAAHRDASASRVDATRHDAGAARHPAVLDAGHVTVHPDAGAFADAGAHPDAPYVEPELLPTQHATPPK